MYEMWNRLSICYIIMLVTKLFFSFVFPFVCQPIKLQGKEKGNDRLSVL